jgi:hypothetical protein
MARPAPVEEVESACLNEVFVDDEFVVCRALKGGGCMQVVSLEAFCAWLCAHEHEVVGRSGTWFHGPLAHWLSDLLGGVYGVDGPYYGRACWDAHWWLPLPRWAVLFTTWQDVHDGCPVLGHEAFALLAQVEVALVSCQAA